MDIIIKKYKIISFIFIAIFAFFTYHIKDFRLDASSDSLVIEDNDDFVYYKQLREDYKSRSGLIMSYQVDGDLMSSSQLEHLAKLTTELKNIKQIYSVTSILNAPLFASPKISVIDLASINNTIENGKGDKELARKEFHTSPLYSDSLVSLDGKVTAISILLKNNVELLNLEREKSEILTRILNEGEKKKLAIVEKKIKNNILHSDELNKQTIADIRKIMAKYQDKAKIFLGGLPMITNDIIAYITDDLLIFSIIILVVMMLVLMIIFNNIRFIFMPIAVSVAVSVLMTGILGFLEWKITVISSNFFSLLLVMTLSIMVHLIVRYRELARDKKNVNLDKNELINRTTKQMVKPCFYTTLTTLIAFISLLISGIRPVIDFGYMMAIGVVIAFIISFISFPIIMSLLPKITIKTNKRNFISTKFFVYIIQKFGVAIIITAILVFIISGYGFSKITVENRFIDYFKSDTPINKGLYIIDRKLGGTVPLEIIFDDFGRGYWYDNDVRNKIKEMHDYFDKLEETGKVLSIDTLMRLLTYANDGTRPSGFFLNIIKNQISDEAKDVILKPYFSEDTGRLRFLMRIRESFPNINRNQFIKNLAIDIEKKFDFSKDSYRINGMMVLYNNMLQSLFTSQIKTVALVFLMIGIMFIILFRSLTLAIIALVSNILPSFAIIGLMGIVGIPLDLMTITIAAISTGIGVDNAIHYIQRFKIEFLKDKNYEKSMVRAHASIGLAMFYTAIVVFFGFMVLVFSNFIPSIYFGALTAIAMIIAVVVNLTLLPKLLIFIKPKIKYI